MGLTYFKRFRMEYDLSYSLPEAPQLPVGYELVPFASDLIREHATAKYQSFRLELDAKNRSDFAGPLQTSIEGADSVFAWSLMVGGSYPVNEVLDISLGYRYISTTDADVNSTIRDIGEGVLFPTLNDPTTSVARRLETEFDAHEVVLGLRVNF